MVFSSDHVERKRFLRDDAHQTFRLQWVAQDVNAENVQIAGGGQELASELAHERSFAGPVGSKKAKDCASSNVQVNGLVGYDAILVTLRKPSNFDRGHIRPTFPISADLGRKRLRPAPENHPSAR